MINSHFESENVRTIILEVSFRNEIKLEIKRWIFLMILILDVFFELMGCYSNSIIISISSLNCHEQSATFRYTFSFLNIKGLELQKILHSFMINSKPVAYNAFIPFVYIHLRNLDQIVFHKFVHEV